MSLRCREGDLAVIVCAYDELEDNLGLLVRVIKPYPELHTECRFCWQVEVVSDRPVKGHHAIAGHLTASNKPDCTCAVAYDDGLRPIRGDDVTEETESAEPVAALSL